MKELTLEATVENITPVTEFVNKQLEATECAPKVRRLIDVAIDELFSNIACYAYVPQTGMATVRVEIQQEQRIIFYFKVKRLVYQNTLFTLAQQNHNKFVQ